MASRGELSRLVGLSDEQVVVLSVASRDEK